MSKNSNNTRASSTPSESTHDDVAASSTPANAAGEAKSPQATQATREDRIRAAAYAAAERRGFAPGFETEDWLDAEKVVDGEGEAQSAQGSAP